MSSNGAAPELAALFTVMKLTEARDEETGQHLERVRLYCQELSRQLPEADANFCALIYHASPLHDIGKVAIPDGVLCKPGKLTDAEYEVMKNHTTLGADALANTLRAFPDDAFIGMVHRIVRWHHEKWDGSGYPDGLAGADIPLEARIMAVADVYDALTSRRCYKEAFSHEDSRRIMEADAGENFEPELIATFFSIEDTIQGIAEDYPD